MREKGVAPVMSKVMTPGHDPVVVKVWASAVSARPRAMRHTAIIKILFMFYSPSQEVTKKVHAIENER